ncbi:MAG: hypothetical protein AB7N54_20165 [Alphaproteobacteria bacterium]
MSTSARQRVMERSARRVRVLADWLAYHDLADLVTDDGGEIDLRRWAYREAKAIHERHCR